MRAGQLRLEQSPDLIGYLLGSALSHGEEDDRFLALTAANHCDTVEGTQFGGMVIRRLLKQANLELLDVGGIDGDSSWISTETPRIGRISTQVALALGPDIGARVVVGKMNEDEKTIQFTSNVPDLDRTEQMSNVRLPLLQLGGESDNLIAASLSQTRPYIVVGIGNSAQMANYRRGLKAVVIGSEELNNWLT